MLEKEKNQKNKDKELSELSTLIKMNRGDKIIDKESVCDGDDIDMNPTSNNQNN